MEGLDTGLLRAVSAANPDHLSLRIKLEMQPARAPARGDEHRRALAHRVRPFIASRACCLTISFMFSRIWRPTSAIQAWKTSDA